MSLILSFCFIILKYLLNCEILFLSVSDEGDHDLFLWNVNHLDVRVIDFKSSFMGGYYVLSKFVGSLSVSIISSSDVGGLGCFERLLGGDRCGSLLSPFLIGLIGLIILSLDEGIWVVLPWESIVINVSGSLKISCSSDSCSLTSSTCGFFSLRRGTR